MVMIERTSLYCSLSLFLFPHLAQLNSECLLVNFVVQNRTNVSSASSCYCVLTQLTPISFYSWRHFTRKKNVSQPKHVVNILAANDFNFKIYAILVQQTRGICFLLTSGESSVDTFKRLFVFGAFQRRESSYVLLMHP
jgi:hypothetical protein